MKIDDITNANAMKVKVIWHTNYNGYTVTCNDPSLNIDRIEEELVNLTTDCYDDDGDFKWDIDVAEKEHDIAYTVRHAIEDMGETKLIIDVEIDDHST